MQPEDYRQLWDFNYWGRDKLLEAAKGLTEEELGATTGFVYPTLRALLTHAVNSESLWLSRWQGQEVVRITQEDIPTIEALAERWAVVEKRMREFFAAADESVLGRPFEVRIRERQE